MPGLFVAGAVVIAVVWGVWGVLGGFSKEKN
jgi:hypothetical protein